MRFPICSALISMDQRPQFRPIFLIMGDNTAPFALLLTQVWGAPPD